MFSVSGAKSGRKIRWLRQQVHEVTRHRASVRRKYAFVKTAHGRRRNASVQFRRCSAEEKVRIAVIMPVTLSELQSCSREDEHVDLRSDAASCTNEPEADWTAAFVP